MHLEHCACGFIESPDTLLIDHLLEMFAPEDSIDSSSTQHDETGKLACTCGFETTAISEMDQHFLLVFRPAINKAPDGRTHLRILPLNPGG